MLAVDVIFHSDVLLEIKVNFSADVPQPNNKLRGRTLVSKLFFPADVLPRNGK